MNPKRLGKIEFPFAIVSTPRDYVPEERLEFSQHGEIPSGKCLAQLVPEFVPRPAGGTERSLDGQAKRLASVIAKCIAEDPSIIDRAIERIGARERAAPDGAMRELAEWRRLLTHLSSRQIARE